MKKEFVPYEQALELKELGFDEPCNTCYDKLQMVSSYGKNVFDYKNYNTSGYVISRPTFSQAFRFFRDKYHLIGCIDFHASYKNYMYNIKEFEYITHKTRFETYEYAELECLKKLIEIAKEQNIKYI